jgi:hypothetical protein
LRADSEAELLTDARGLRLHFGEVNSRVAKAASPATTGPVFAVLTSRAEYMVKGTVFDVQSDASGDRLLTDEGGVEASTRTSAGVSVHALVQAGEEVRIAQDPARLEVQLQPPQVSVVYPSGQPIENGAARSRDLVLQGRARPGAMLTLQQGDGAMQQGQVDGSGRFTQPIQLTDGDGLQALTVTVSTPDRAARATNLTINLDTQAPTLTLDLPQVNGQRVRIGGETDPDAKLSVNGVVVPVGPQGNFSAEVAFPDDHVLRLVARDAAGNETTVARVVQLDR